MEPQVEFIGWQIKPKEEVSVAEELENDSLVTIHITQVALGDAASNDRHTVFITNETGKFAIGTLDREKPHFSVDFMAAESDLIFSHTGSSDVYVTGYKTRSELMPDGLTYFDGEDPSDDDEDEDDEDDEQPPQAIPLGSKRRAALMAAQRARDEEDDDEDDEEDEEDDEDFNEEQQALLNAQEFSDLEDEDDEDEEDDDDDEEEDQQASRALRGLAPAGAPNGMGMAMMEDDDEDDEDEDDEEDDEEAEEDDQKNTSAAINRQFAAAQQAAADDDDDDDEDEDDEDDEDDDEEEGDELLDDEEDDEDNDDLDEPAADVMLGGKRPMVPKTPQPAKKPKVEAKAPKSAPAKMGKGASEVAEFQAKLIETLRSKGSMSISALGGIVKRPAGIPKFKKFLDESGAFKVDGSLNVSLA